MPSEGLQRLQRLSAAVQAQSSSSGGGASSKLSHSRGARNATSGGGRKPGYRRRVLFLPLLAFVLMAVGVLTPGLGDFLPHSRTVSKQAREGGVAGGATRKLITDLPADTAEHHLPLTSLREQVQQQLQRIKVTGAAATDAATQAATDAATQAATGAAVAEQAQEAAAAEAAAKADAEAAAAKQAADAAQQQQEAAARAAADAAAAQQQQEAAARAAADAAAAQQQQGGAAEGQLTDAELDHLVNEAMSDLPEDTAADAAVEAAAGGAAVIGGGAVVAEDGSLLVHEGEEEDDEEGGAAHDGHGAVLVDPGLEEMLRAAGAAGEKGTLMEGEEEEEEENKGATTTPCEPPCSWHGGCAATGKCACATTYAGALCANPVLLSWPFVPSGMADFSARFEGDFVLSKESVGLAQQLAFQPAGAPGTPPVVIADAPLIEQVLPVLPEVDTVAKPGFYSSCAVVGSSAALLHWELGTAIDEHDMVMRFNSAHTEGLKFSVGSKTTHRVTNLGNWGYHESNLEAVFVPASRDALQGLLWNAAQPSPRTVHVLHPDFESYLRSNFDFEPDAGLAGLLLALHRCRKVTVYGFSLIDEPGVPYHYYDGCDRSADPARDAKQRDVLRALAGAGLLSFGEPCMTECTSDPAAAPSSEACQACRAAAGYNPDPPNYPQAEDCVPGEGAKGHNPAPWMQQQQQAAAA